MAELTRSTVIEAPVEKVFDFASDIGQFWTLWHSEVSVRDVEVQPDGVGTSARLFAHFLAFSMEGTVEYTEVVRNERIVAEVHFFAENPTWVFTFEPVESGTKFTAKGEWHARVPVVGERHDMMMVKGHEEDLETLLATMKSQLEAETQATV